VGESAGVDLAAKLQLKPGQSVFVGDIPAGVSLSLGADVPVLDEPAGTDAVVVFCADVAAYEGRRGLVAGAARDDRLTWVAYPKAGKLGTDLNRDALASLVMQDDGIRPVRQISIDDTWSALRFRPGSL
jgi:hypothetical protein